MLKKAFIVSLSTDTKELEALAASAGYEIKDVFVQKRKIDNRFFVGHGKLAEIKSCLDNDKIDAVIFNGTLKPSQHYNIESYLKVRVFDRLQLILDIFVSRAHSREAKLQVEAAKLKYELPLVREWIHKTKLHEHPGFLGGGEYQIDEYYGYIQRRLKKINYALENIRTSHRLRRVARVKTGFKLVSIAGYANAGKSTLLNTLTDETVTVDDRLFSTLSVTTRSLKRSKARILITDTIGLIDDLPDWLVETFDATLDEIYEADVILLVIDGSDTEDEFIRKLHVCKKILFKKIENNQFLCILPVISKVDLLSEKQIAKKSQILFADLNIKPVAISAKYGIGINTLIERLTQMIIYTTKMCIVLKKDSQISNLLPILHDNAINVNVVYGNHIELTCSCDDRFAQQIESIIKRTCGAENIVSIRKIKSTGKEGVGGCE